MEPIAILWLIIGGLLEPFWVISLKKSESFKRIGWALVTIFFMIASPYFLSLAMLSIPLGTAYAVWTGIGAIGTLIAGFLVYNEKVQRIQIFFVFVILAGVVGLQIFGGV
ncbi:MAG TPA: multidrug efflux SMR transporter [Candidatus Methanomethylophilaceae archaeon]|nr:multidrug efflux SMR transporter [Candidatus Methanomethylophilaceae archaeon]